MRYLVLIHLDEAMLDAMPERDMSVLNDRHLELNESLLKSGVDWNELERRAEAMVPTIDQFDPAYVENVIVPHFLVSIYDGERLSLPMIGALETALDALRDDAAVRAVVIAAKGRGFCAGHDLKEMRAEPSMASIAPQIACTAPIAAMAITAKAAAPTAKAWCWPNSMPASCRCARATAWSA